MSIRYWYAGLYEETDWGWCSAILDIENGNVWIIPNSWNH